MPFNWLSQSNVQLYVSPSLGTNAIFVGDQDIDYAQRAAEYQALGLAASTASGGPPLPGGGEGMPEMAISSTDGRSADRLSNQHDSEMVSG